MWGISLTSGRICNYKIYDAPRSCRTDRASGPCRDAGVRERQRVPRHFDTGLLCFSASRAAPPADAPAARGSGFRRTTAAEGWYESGRGRHPSQGCAGRHRVRLYRGDCGWSSPLAPTRGAAGLTGRTPSGLHPSSSDIVFLHRRGSFPASDPRRPKTSEPADDRRGSAKRLPRCGGDEEGRGAIHSLREQRLRVRRRGAGHCGRPPVRPAKGLSICRRVLSSACGCRGDVHRRQPRPPRWGTTTTQGRPRQNGRGLLEERGYAEMEEDFRDLRAAIEDNALTPVGVMRTELELPGE